MCTNVTIPRKSKDDALISARTLDWFTEDNFKSSIANFVPRGQFFPESSLPGEMHWRNKYSFIGIGIKTKLIPIAYSDGLNETGLSAACLSLFSSKYPKRKYGKPILYNPNLVSYILGNFKNIQEVKQALSEITIVNISELLPEENISSLLHYIVSDIYGNHLIIEFVDGEMKLYTSRLGVLTNDPTYDWQLTNNNFYSQLSLENTTTLVCNELISTNGQLGIPGDISPQARFVRAAFLRRTAFNPQTTQEAIGVAKQIIQTLAVPIGTVIVSAPQIPAGSFDWTQWSVIRDHTNLSYYFCSGFNSKLYGIHLKKLNLNSSEQRHIDVIQPDWYEDVTGKLECRP